MMPSEPHGDSGSGLGPLGSAPLLSELDRLPRFATLNRLLSYLILPRSVLVAVGWLIATAPYAAHPHSLACQVVYTVLACLIMLAGIGNVWVNVYKLWNHAGELHTIMGILLPLDLGLATSWAFSCVGMIFWVWDPSPLHNKWLTFVGTPPADPWQAATYFFATGAWVGLGGAFGPMIPGIWFTSFYYGIYAYAVRFGELAIVSVLFAYMWEKKRAYSKSKDKEPAGDGSPRRRTLHTLTQQDNAAAIAAGWTDDRPAGLPVSYATQPLTRNTLQHGEWAVPWKS